MNDVATQILVRSADFLEGEFSTRNMTFGVPTGQIFTATSLSLIPYRRRISIDRAAAGADDVVFTPTVWSSDVSQFSSAAFVNTAVDLLWRLSETVGGTTREYQNAPCSAAAAFSGTHIGWWLAETSAYPGSLVFDTPWVLPGGSSLSCQITPTYTGTCPTAGRKNQFRIVAMLHGLRGIQ